MIIRRGIEKPEMYFRIKRRLIMRILLGRLHLNYIILLRGDWLMRFILIALAEFYKYQLWIYRLVDEPHYKTPRYAAGDQRLLSGMRQLKYYSLIIYCTNTSLTLWHWRYPFEYIIHYHAECHPSQEPLYVISVISYFELTVVIEDASILFLIDISCFIRPPAIITT